MSGTELFVPAIASLKTQFSTLVSDAGNRTRGGRPASPKLQRGERGNSVSSPCRKLFKTVGFEKEAGQASEFNDQGTC